LLRRLLTLSLLVLAVTATGCRRTLGSAEAGAGTSQEAVVQFLDAARAKDMQAMSAVWGNAEQPTRDIVERRELEQRLLVMICVLRHDESRIGVPQPGEGGRQIYPVELKQGTKQATVPFTTIRNTKTGRWFVEEFDPRPVRDFCQQAQSLTRPRRD
jgi:hypothetical protein